MSAEPRGTAIVRFFRALGLANGDLVEARSIAANLWPTSRTADFCRAASFAGTTIASDRWGAELVPFETASAEFFELVRVRSIPGQMAGIRRAPLSVRLIAETQAPSASWVREAKAKPISEQKFVADHMRALKVTSTVVVTLELLKTSSPAAEDWLRASLTGAMAKVINSSFIDPGNAGIPDEEPASVTHDAHTVASTGDWAADLAAALALSTGDIETSFLLMNGLTAVGLSGLQHPNLDTRGGSLSGIPVITDPALANGLIVIADAAQIAFAEGPVIASASVQGAVEMSTTPTGVATLSMWQLNCTGLRAEMPINWKLMRPGAVVTVTGVGG